MMPASRIADVSVKIVTLTSHYQVFGPIGAGNDG
jgi:hypothetical protein